MILKMVQYLRFTAPALALAVLAGCGGGPGVHDDPGGGGPTLLWPDAYGVAGAERSGCGSLPAATGRGGDFKLAVVDSVRPGRAPVPGNDAERLVFAQFYEGLVGTSCDGRPVPALAESWESEDGAVWIFTLRPGARLWDGTPVTAALVMEAWERNRTLPGVPTGPDLLPLQARVLEDGRLEVRPAVPAANLPRLLTHPAWSVAVARPGWTWPVGSGPARLRAATPPPLPEIVCRPYTLHRHAPRWKTLTIGVRPGADPRDLVADDPDLLLVRRADAVTFFDALPGYGAHPLPWDRLHLLVMPGDNDALAQRLRGAAAGLDPGRDMAGAQTVRWSHRTLPTAPLDRVPVGRFDPVPRGGRLDSDLARIRLDDATLIHDRNDPLASELAGRLTALAGAGVRTVGLRHGDLLTALQWRSAGAGLLTVRPDFVDPALQLAHLCGRFPWLAGPTGQVGADDPRLVPVAVSRAWLVSRTGVGGVTVRGDGVPLLAGLGPAAGDLP